MKRILLLAASLAVLAVLASCAPTVPAQPMKTEASQPMTTEEMPMEDKAMDMENMPMEAQYRQMTAQEAKARMDSGDPVIILDVRTQSEFEEKRIPGAILLPNEEIGSEPPTLLPDLNAEILVYCRSGNRSRQASEKLVKMGYTRVYDFGGINAWPYDTESGM